MEVGQPKLAESIARQVLTFDIVRLILNLSHIARPEVLWGQIFILDLAYISRRFSLDLGFFLKTKKYLLRHPVRTFDGAKPQF
jgi:hypothetical protein